MIERSVAEQLKSETDCCGVTLAQCHALVELGDAGAINLAGLAERMELDASTLSRTVDSMVKAGLITRDINSDNRRAVVISLTKKGEERLEFINRSCNEYYGKLLDSIPSGKRASLLDGIRMVADIFAAQTKDIAREVKNG